MPVLLAATVLLHLGIHVDAGGVQDVAVDGAAGQCTAGPSWLQCPATGPVTFRWGPGEASGWVLTGDTTVQPGAEGIAYGLATEALATEARADLQVDTVTPTTVRHWFVREGTHQPPAPSADQLADLISLCGHPDPKVRREVLEGLHPWFWRSALGPLSATAPIPIPTGTVEALSRDEDPGVRRRLAVFLRDMREGHLTEEAEIALLRLTRDEVKGVRRAAIASLSQAATTDVLAPEDAWLRAMQGVPQLGSPGRTSANTLAKLEAHLEPSETVDPVLAVELVLAHHPERAWKVWGAWKADVPFRRPWVDLLLRGTIGIGPGLLRYWSETHPEELAAALVAWESAEPHSERFELLQRHLYDIEPPLVRDALDLPAAIEAPERPKKQKRFELKLPPSEKVERVPLTREEKKERRKARKKARRKRERAEKKAARQAARST